MQLSIRIIITTLLLAVSVLVYGSDAHIVDEASATDTVPVYVRIVSDPYVEGGYLVSDSLFYEIAGSVIFRVNRTELNVSAPILGEIVDRVVPLTKSRRLKLEAIELRGAASPEGPYDNNVRLSQGRAKALLDYLAPYLGKEAVEKINVATTAEDYLNLLYALRQQGDEAAAVVQDIIDTYGIDDHASIKTALQKYDGGKLWRRLLRDVFPGLRAARIVLYLSPVELKLDYDFTPTIADIIFLPVAEPSGYAVERTAMPVKPERHHMISIGTNLLYDAMYIPQYGMAPMPNVQVEYYPRRGNFTFAGAFTFPYFHRWSKHKFFQLRDYHLEVRRYFKPGLYHTGAYLGAYINNNIYGIGFSATKGWEGEGFGGAVKLGYVAHLGGRWRLDMHAAFGGYTTRYDPYVYGNPITGDEDGDYYYDYTGKIKDFNRRNHRFSWFGPTEVGITLTYDLIFHKSKHPSH